MTRWWGPHLAVEQSVTGSVVFGDNIQISGVGGNVTISLDRPPYRVVPADDAPLPLTVERARAQPSRLLLARHQVVPFTGREHTLDTLAAWVGGEEPVAALLLHAAGGQGKTRLAAQVSAQCAAAGWAVWQVTHTPSPVAGSAAVSTVELAGGAVLVLVDYADRWPASALLGLLTQLGNLHARAGTRVRVLMLARSDGYWWPALAERADSDLGIEVDQRALPALAADSADDRTGLFVAAAARFATALDLESANWPVPDLTGDGFGQVLAVHMAALATVDATRHGEAPPTQVATVSAYLLRRELAYWSQLHTRTELSMHSPPAVMHRTVVAATLTGGQPRDAARHALVDAGVAASGTAADQIIDDHTTCYPPADTRTVFEPLHPDRLGEDLIALSTPGHGNHGVVDLERDWTPAAIAGLLTTSALPPVWAAAAFTVLVETARRWPHVAIDVLYPLIREHPQLAITAGGATLTRLTGIPGIDPGVLEILEPLLPAGRHIDLDIATAAITGALTHHRLTHTSDPAEQARLHATHAFRVANAGWQKEAMASAKEAVSIYRRLAKTSPDPYLTNLAVSLNYLGNSMSALGWPAHALVATEEAVGIRRRLAETNPDAHLPHLAILLTNLGGDLSVLGRREQALGPAEEAVGIYRRLAKTNPDAYLPDFALSLSNLGVCLSVLGRQEQALAPTEEAAGIRRRLAQTNPHVHLPDLATSLDNFGICLSALGRQEQALAPTEEAAGIRRRLAETNPDAYLPDLAASLNNLGACLGDVGQWEQSLAPIEEAAGIRRRLAETNPDAHLSHLAMLSRNLGRHLSEAGRGEQALAPAEEAARIYRRLAETNPDAYLSAFLGSLITLCSSLMKLGQRGQALARAMEADSLRRRLAETNPDTDLPELAQSLSNLRVCLMRLDEPEQALASAEEATGIWRRLAQGNPDAHLPNLAMSLWTYAATCVNVQANLPQALDSILEALDLYGSLRQRQPRTFAARLFVAHQTLADVLDGLGRTDEALDVRRQLDEISARMQK
ncbi:hypothetical protein Ais01nite_02590 [Asanoa ishikariensis]|uniref:Tetratricopeptide repeat-containing protein n=1 Tax=Asanoa ishikariensis TaxID=137265 RepID=A0A1H3TKL4_9ACTN|nr:tetratricopeptide repeat protein [Asanoa ishikariensis]GIF62224.1 hypothetical protein Ais01nite_02590 [Asanoa ishikariensis]SDZ50832.1 Tetratricopeptide repeat-containing protein [Asanoa ishikariensis]